MPNMCLDQCNDIYCDHADKKDDIGYCELAKKPINEIKRCFRYYVKSSRLKLSKELEGKIKESVEFPEWLQSDKGIITEVLVEKYYFIKCPHCDRTEKYNAEATGIRDKKGHCAHCNKAIEIDTLLPSFMPKKMPLLTLDDGRTLHLDGNEINCEEAKLIATKLMEIFTHYPERVRPVILYEWNPGKAKVKE